MWFYKKLLIYRLYIGIVLLALSAYLAYVQEWGWFTFVLFLALLAIVSHFLFGPLRLIQEAFQNNDMVLAQKYIDSVKFPQLLLKPIRQGFYMLKSNVAMSNKDFSSAETYLKESLKSSSKMMGQENEGASYFQLGMLAAQRGKTSEARKNFRAALAKGLPDKDTKAATLLQLAAVEINARNLKQGRDYFKKAKALNPKTPEIKAQLLQMEKYVHRVR